MKRKRFSTEQIVAVLKLAEMGLAVVAPGCFRKSVLRSALMKDVVDYVTACHGFSERRACSLTRQH